MMAPSFFAAARFSSLSSHANTRAPPSTSDFTDATPDRASPKTATSIFAKVVETIMSLPQLQCRKTDKRQYHGNDPEADNDGGFLPAQLFEMMMDGRHLEDALAGELE